MIFLEVRVSIINKSGFKNVKCIKILNKNNKYSYLGSLALLTLEKSIVEDDDIKLNESSFGIITHLKKPSFRMDGRYLIFNKNNVVLLSADLKPLGYRLKHPITKEMPLKTKSFLEQAKNLI